MFRPDRISTNARIRSHPVRAGPHVSHHSDRHAPAHRSGHSALSGRLARALGRQYSRRRRHESRRQALVRSGGTFLFERGAHGRALHPDRSNLSRQVASDDSGSPPAATSRFASHRTLRSRRSDLLRVLAILKFLKSTPDGSVVEPSLSSVATGRQAGSRFDISWPARSLPRSRDCHSIHRSTP